MARQRLGQHFLADQGVLRRIAEAACGVDEPLVVEIGPGKGALTKYLVHRAKQIVTIELDRELAADLPLRVPGVEVIQGDALDLDFNRWPGAPITGNLPYYVATPIISRAVRVGRRATFLIQKEVAQRICAPPGSRDYGYFSVEVQLFAEPKILFTVKPGAFQPPPQVDSALIRLTPRAVEVPDPESFLKFVSLAFRHKRKTLRNNLSLYPLIDEQPESGARAETLSLAEFASLFRRLVP